MEKNEVLIFVTQKQLENKIDWFCYISFFFLNLLMEETDYEDYKFLKTKSCRITLIFDAETYKQYRGQQTVRDVNDFVNKAGTAVKNIFHATTLNEKLCILNSYVVK